LAQIVSNISSTTPIFISNFLSEQSITCNNISDSIESSSVDLNASINFGGNSLINQIVSFINTSFGGIYTQVFSSYEASTNIFHTLVQRVANSLSSANTHFLVSAFVRVDFQAFVYPTTQTVFIPFLFLHCLC